MSCPCIFCDFPDKELIIADFEHCFVIRDKFPVSKGHLLVVSKNHSNDWFDASLETQMQVMEVLNLMKQWLDDQYKPAGYNIGTNCGPAAGQSIMHLHVHLIPRYTRDVANPKGGIRGVIPEKQCY